MMQALKSNEIELQPANGRAVGLPLPLPLQVGSSTASSSVETVNQNQNSFAPIANGGAVINKLTGASVNVEATQKYIGILHEKIHEYERALDGVRAQLKLQASRAVVELDRCSTGDCAKQERTKRRLENEHGELKLKAHKLHRTVRKLEFKLTELKTYGIPIDVVADDYVRQLQPNKDQATSVGVSSSSASSASGVPRRVLGSFVASKPAAVAAAVPPSIVKSATAAGDASTSSSVHRTASSSDLLPGPSRRLMLSSESRDEAPTRAPPTVVSTPSIVGGGLSEIDRLTLSSSDPSAAPSASPPRLPATSTASSSLMPAVESSEESLIDRLRLHYERRLLEQRAAFVAELDALRQRAADEAGDIQRLVDAELGNLRYDQQELAASAEDGRKELDKMKLFLTNLSNEIARMLLVDQQIDDMNNRLAVITRDLVQNQSACSLHHHHHHHHPDAGQGGAAGARLLNMLVAVLSYAFVAASCLVNLLIWLLRLPSRRPFAAFCLAIFAAPLILMWLGCGGGGPDGGMWLAETLPDLIVKFLPLSARRRLGQLLIRLNATLA